MGLLMVIDRTLNYEKPSTNVPSRTLTIVKLDIYEVVRSNAPSIQGTATFNQYLSIRTSERTSGTITFANHIAAWTSLGMVSKKFILL